MRLPRERFVLAQALHQLLALRAVIGVVQNGGHSGDRGFLERVPEEQGERGRQRKNEDENPPVAEDVQKLLFRDVDDGAQAGEG